MVTGSMFVFHFDLLPGPIGSVFVFLKETAPLADTVMFEHETFCKLARMQVAAATTDNVVSAHHQARTVHELNANDHVLPIHVRFRS